MRRPLPPATGPLAAAAACLAVAASGAAAIPLKVVTHLHSDFSHTGREPLETIAERVRRAGADVFIPTDTLVAEWEFGLWPLRGLVRRRLRRPSVLAAGPESYLRRLEALRQAHPKLVVIAGVEAAAYYRWAGSPWSGLTIEDWNRHLIILGLDTPEDYRGLPVLGNSSAGGLRWERLWPASLLALGGALWLLLRRRAACVVAAAGTALLVAGRPYRGPSWDPYAAATSWEPYQGVIDQVRQRGGLCFWAHPDAPNWESPVLIRPGMSSRSRPYPEAILETRGHDGFGVLLEGWRKTAVPGGPWDQALRLYLDGGAPRPVWAFAETDYHDPSRDNAGSPFMIVEAESRTSTAVLAALRAGRFYSARSGPRGSPVVAAWRVRPSSGGVPAGPGQTLTSAPPYLVELDLAYDGPAPASAQVQLIRDGRIIKEDRLPVPGRLRAEDPGGEPQSSFYRAWVRDSDGGQAVTNPIFVRRPVRGP